MEKWNEVTNRRISTSYALLQKKIASKYTEAPW